MKLREKKHKETDITYFFKILKMRFFIALVTMEVNENVYQKVSTIRINVFNKKNGDTMVDPLSSLPKIRMVLYHFVVH